MAAVQELAPRGQAFEQDCSKCSSSPHLREQWGCDAPVAEPLAWIGPCPFCAGERDECQHCEGTSRIPLHRCPNTMAGDAEREMVRLVQMTEHGILPEPGGWHDQPATFVQAYPLLLRELQHWRQVHYDLEAKKQRQKRRGR